ncbi:MAG: MBL fold metallo-hydrolase [Myxococcota bacterium]
MRVHHLNCATLCTAAPRLLRDARALVCHVLVVEADDGLVLVDAGLSTHDVRDATRRLGRAFRWLVRPALREEETALRQIERLGFVASDVRHVVLTHLDLDHAGGIADFPRAKVHAMLQEHEAAHLRTAVRERSRYREAQLEHFPDFELYRTRGASWFGLDAVALRGLPEDVRLVPLFGHTRGHAGVAVRGDEGWMLHAGDAYFHFRETEGGHAPLMLRALARYDAMDDAARRESRARVAALARAGEVRVFCAHDATEFEKATGYRPTEGA